MATAPAVLNASIARANTISWHDIRFDMSDDERTLTVVEVEVLEDRTEETVPDDKSDKAGKKEVRYELKCRTDLCCWKVPAAAFGDRAWFDIEKPKGDIERPGIDQDGKAKRTSPRTIVVHDVRYGAAQPATIRLVFSRPTSGHFPNRWHLVVNSDVWLAENGKRAISATAPCIPLHRFLADDVEKGAVVERLPAGRIRTTIRSMFEERLRVASKSKLFDVRFRKDLAWSLEAVDGLGGLEAFGGQVTAKHFSLGWRRSSDDPADVFFAGSALLEAGKPPRPLMIGDANGHRIEIRPDAVEASTLPLQARIGRSPLLPNAFQTVVTLGLRQADIAVYNAGETLMGQVGASELTLAETGIPTEKQLVRTTLWGDSMLAPRVPPEPAKGPAPLPAVVAQKGPAARADCPDPKGATAPKPAGRIAIGSGGSQQAPRREPMAIREIPSPIGRIRVAAPERDELRKPDSDASTTPAPAKGPLDRDCACSAEGDAATSTKAEARRLFEMACGRGGPEATLYAVHDVNGRKGAAVGLRRIAIELDLIEASVGLPDVSYSRLTFARSDLRFSYDDGAELLALGEFPRPHVSSFIWAGPLTGEPRSELDLSRATLTCARDYDLMKLRLRFHDLVLTLAGSATLRPARADCRLMELDTTAMVDGELRTVGEKVYDDSRPILVAEFDPQHVMEEALFRPEPPPLPDVEPEEAAESEDRPKLKCDGFDGEPTRVAILAHLERLKGSDKEQERVKFRSCVAEWKSLNEPGRDSRFRKFHDLFEPEASSLGLPPDQRIYIGPYGLDPDAMALARRIQHRSATGVVREAVEAMLERVDGSVLDKLVPVGERPVEGKPETRPKLAQALERERKLESQEPLYALFRDHYRERMVRSVDDTSVRSTADGKSANFERPESIGERDVEYVTPRNRPEEFLDPEFARQLEARLVVIRASFIDLVTGRDPIESLVGARLSGPSRLAFRVNCQPIAGLDAEEVGLPGRSQNSPAKPGRANSYFEPIPFNFEALTDWSRHEPAVTKRARKLFTALPSGIIPPLGNRAPNVADHDILAFQGFKKGLTTAETRIGETRGSMSVVPTVWETAIEIPSRLILSTAQDAIWRTDRRLPREILEARLCEDPNEPDPATPERNAPELEDGLQILKPGQKSCPPAHDLWSARLIVRESSPAVRAVQSPDFRPTAIGGGRHLDELLPGHGAPPRGPYAPWFVGPEQLENKTLSARDFHKSGSEEAACKAENSIRLIRWLCGRAAARKAVPVEDYKFFRTSLDAYDRHQLVMLTSAYGLPVVGPRNPLPKLDQKGEPLKDKDGKPIYEDDVERGGELTENSGAIEPGEDYGLLDASNSQAIYRPIPLNVSELSLTALGGSLVHDTTFKPLAGETGLKDRKLFDGFSIERWRHHIVLGRDIRGEVVYKGYLFPLGHRASLIKLTERVFLLTPDAGVKALLRQRMFLRVGTRRKDYPAVGQPHRGRLWCAEAVHLLTGETPDIIDPTFPLGEEAEDAGAEAINGRIGLGGSPGLAFWPRTDISKQGLIKFEFKLDDVPTELPLIFLDNIAATTKGSLAAVVKHYGDQADIARRTIELHDAEVRFAPEIRRGDASYKTESVVLGAHGRLRSQGSGWVGDVDEFLTTGVLEGAEQPPFYPRMDKATIRIEQAERLSQGGRRTVDVQYDGHYVRNGFPARGAGPDAPPVYNGNPLEVFLNLRRAVKLSMGESGDRSAGVCRPDSNIIALSRTKGPVGGDGDIRYEEVAPVDLAAPVPEGTAPVPVGSDPLIRESDHIKLVSLSAYYDMKRSPATGGQEANQSNPMAPAVQPAEPNPLASAASTIEDIQRTLKIVQSVFDGDAKVLGTIRVKDVLKLLGLPSPGDMLPALKQTIDYGTAALREVGDTAADLANDVRTRVLSPLRQAVGRLRAEWAKLDKELVARQRAALAGTGQAADAVDALSLDKIYPEVSQGLGELEAALDAALSENDPLALAPKLAAVYEAGRRFARVLAEIAANPVERLKDAVGAQLQNYLAVFSGDLDRLLAFADEIRELVRTLQSVDGAVIARRIAAWLAAQISVTSTNYDEVFGKLSLVVRPIETQAIANGLWPTLPASTAQRLAKIDGELNAAFRFGSGDLEAVIYAFIAPWFDKEAAPPADQAIKALIQAKKARMTGALATARVELQQIGGDLQTALLAELRTYEDYLVRELLAKLADAATVVRTNLPPEFAALVASADRATAAFERLKAIGEAVQSGKPKDVLRAVSAFAVDVFGVDPAAMIGKGEAEIRDFVAQVAESAGVDSFIATTSKRIADLVGAGGLAVVNRANLLAEAAACAAWVDGGAADSVPVKNFDTKSSSELTRQIASLIATLDEAAVQAADAKKVITNNEPAIKQALDDAGEGPIADLKQFQDNTIALIGGDDPGPDSLRKQARLLYCDAVRLSTALAAGPETLGAGWRIDQADGLSRLSQLTRNLLAASENFGNRIGVISGALSRFAADPQNSRYVTFGLVAGAAGFLFNTAKLNAVSALFAPAWAKLQGAEADLALNLAKVVNFCVELVRKGALLASASIDRLRAVVAQAEPLLDGAGLTLRPESGNLVGALDQLKKIIEQANQYEAISLTPPPTGINAIKIKTPEGVVALSKAFSPAGYQAVATQLRALEAKALADWNALRQRLLGLPKGLQDGVEARVMDAGVAEKLAEGYGILVRARREAFKQVEKIPLLRSAARDALFVEAGLGECAAGEDRTACDRLDEELKIVTAAAAAKKVTPKLRRVLGGWTDGRAAPLVIVQHAGRMASDAMRGDVLSMIDVGAFRDEIENAIAELIPTKANLSFDFASTFDKPSKDDAIFQPKVGEPFGVEVRATIDLLQPKEAFFRARGHIGAFDIKLVGGLIDAVKLKFGGAAFEFVGGAKPKFDVIYSDFEIGKDLEFAQKLQSFLKPKEGSGVFVQPLTRTVGIEAGYGLDLGTISIGNCSFFNVSLNVSAELPFSDQDALFKVSLGRRLNPFTVSVAPFGGAGYFSIFAAADGIRGFEASFEFGGAGALGFGPLQCQARIMAGVFVRVLKVSDDLKITEIYGTFFAGGTASIWIFNFSTSLYVRLGSSSNGDMYGEAIYSFSFSLGIVDYDYSVTAFRKEQKLGSGKQASSGGGGRSGAFDQLIRYAGLDAGEEIQLVSLSRGGGAVEDAASQVEDWPTYQSYFDTKLLRSCEDW